MRRAMLIAIFGLLCAGVAHADVTTEDKSQVKFAGVLGRMTSLLAVAGRATRLSAPWWSRSTGWRSAPIRHRDRLPS